MRISVCVGGSDCILHFSVENQSNGVWYQQEDVFVLIFRINGVKGKDGLGIVLPSSIIFECFLHPES